MKQPPGRTPPAYGFLAIITGSLPPESGLYLSVASSVPSRIGTWIVSQTTPGKFGFVTGVAFAASAAPSAAVAASTADINLRTNRVMDCPQWCRDASGGFRSERRDPRPKKALHRSEIYRGGHNGSS